MYSYLKDKFGISEDEVTNLVKNIKDCEELFSDYESLCFQMKKVKADKALYELYLETMHDLEKEIAQLLSKHLEILKKHPNN